MFIIVNGKITSVLAAVFGIGGKMVGIVSILNLLKM